MYFCQMNRPYKIIQTSFYLSVNPAKYYLVITEINEDNQPIRSYHVEKPQWSHYANFEEYEYYAPILN